MNYMLSTQIYIFTLWNISNNFTLQNIQTALHVAAGLGNTQAVKLLLDNMADIYAVDKVYILLLLHDGG